MTTTGLLSDVGRHGRDFISDYNHLDKTQKIITPGVSYGTQGKSGEILWRRIADPYSQEAKYGAIFVETDRNMEKNMEANMASLGFESLWA